MVEPFPIGYLPVLSCTFFGAIFLLHAMLLPRNDPGESMV